MSISTPRSLSVRSHVIGTEDACMGNRRVSAISQQPKKPKSLFNNHKYWIKEDTMKSFKWIVMSSLAIFLLATSTSWAQEVSSPPTTCADGSIGTCVGDILDVQLDTINEVEGLLMDMQAMNMFSFGRDQFSMAAQGGDTQEDFFARIETLRKQHTRAKGANDATTDFEFDEMMEQADTDKGKNCKFSDKLFVESLDGAPPPGLKPDGLDDPNSNYNDGKCNIFDAFDLDGNPVKVNERKENMCERVCEEKMVGGQGQRGKSKDRIIGDLVDALSTARGAMRSLSAQRARITELGLILADYRLTQASYRVSTAASGPSGPIDPCAPGTPGPGPDLIAVRALNITIITLDSVLVAGNIVTEVLKTIADIADKPCKQTVAGFNASAACIPFTVAAHISSGIFGIVGGAKNILVDSRNIVVNEAKITSASKADNAKACSKIIRDDFDGGSLCINSKCDGGPDDGSDCIDDIDCSDGAIFILQADVTKLKAAAGETNAQLAEVRAELALMKSLLEETRDFLLTPTGRRVGFARP